MTTEHGTRARLEELRRNLRRGTLFLMFGLVVSGLTAIPIPTEMAIAARVLGPDFSAGGWLPRFAVEWARSLSEGIRATELSAPFMFYGTDWLAFGHLVIAGVFIGALQDPVRNRWLYRFGMGACIAVPLWALVFGALRGIPLWWRVIDASFGFVGFIPAWLCDRWAREAEDLENRQ